MALEIERRFLVDTEKLPEVNCGYVLVQGYLNKPGSPFTVRARVSTGVYGRKLAFMTIKSKVEYGVNKEFEYNIPVEDAEEIISLCQTRVITKARYLVGPFEVDVFEGPLQGLVIAEIELKDITENFDKPDWLGVEITDMREFSNSNMASDPTQAMEKFGELTSNKKTS